MNRIGVNEDASRALSLADANMKGSPSYIEIT